MKAPRLTLVVTTLTVAMMTLSALALSGLQANKDQQGSDSSKSNLQAEPFSLSLDDIVEIDIMVSPQTIILEAPVTWVTVHTDIPQSMVERDTVALNYIPARIVTCDARGYLVAKFDFDDIKAIVAPPEAVLGLSGLTIDGALFAGVDVVPVKFRLK